MPKKQRYVRTIALICYKYLELVLASNKIKQLSNVTNPDIAPATHTATHSRSVCVLLWPIIRASEPIRKNSFRLPLVVYIYGVGPVLRVCQNINRWGIRNDNSVIITPAGAPRRADRWVPEMWLLTITACLTAPGDAECSKALRYGREQRGTHRRGGGVSRIPRCVKGRRPGRDLYHRPVRARSRYIRKSHALTFPRTMPHVGMAQSRRGLLPQWPRRSQARHHIGHRARGQSSDGISRACIR